MDIRCNKYRKRVITLCITLLAMAAAGAMADEPDANSGEEENLSRMITILHTNDLHGHLEPWEGWEGEFKNQRAGGLDRLAVRIREARLAAVPDSVLLLDAGDTLGDTMIAAETEGRAVIEAMNVIGYDAMVIGNHELDFTAGKLRTRIAEARFPVLAANIMDRTSGELFTKPYVIVTLNRVRIGILGLAYPNTPLTTARKNVNTLRFGDAVKTARTYVPLMRREGAQIVIALTHLGLSADRELAQNVDGIDVIVGGHSHNRMREALQVRQTLIVQAGAHGSDLGQLDLHILNGRITAHRRTLIPITDETPAGNLAKLIERQREPYEQKMEASIGRALTLIPRAQTLAGQESEKRDAESPADDLFADAIRATTKTEIAFLPGVGYGIALQPGTITAEQLRNLIPHDSPIWTLRLSGNQIRQVLEQAIENVLVKDPAKKVGGMIQVSGLQFSYNPDAPSYLRVKKITVGGRALKPRRQYTVAINGLLAEGGHNYQIFRQGLKRLEVGNQYEMVKTWIEAQGGVAAPPTDRITKVANKAGKK